MVRGGNHKKSQTILGKGDLVTTHLFSIHCLFKCGISANQLLALTVLHNAEQTKIVVTFNLF